MSYTESKNIVENEKMTRGSLLQKLAVAPIAIGAFALLKAQEADAAKTAQSAVMYVNHPSGSKKCSGCKFYQAAKGKGNGACQIVAGSISPNGYCVAYAAK